MEEKERKEDTTKYGEFITSYFAWLTLEKQKEIANKLSDITKKWDNVSLFCYIVEHLSKI